MRGCGGRWRGRRHLRRDRRARRRAQFFSPGPLARPHARSRGSTTAPSATRSRRACRRSCASTATPSCSAGRQERRLPRPPAPSAGVPGLPPRPPRRRLRHGRLGGRPRQVRPPAHRLAAEGRARQGPLRRLPPAKLIVDPAIRRLLEKQPKRTTFLGRRQRCDGVPFRRAPRPARARVPEVPRRDGLEAVAELQPQGTEFPLRGKHKDVACAKCHPIANDEHFPATAFPKPRAASFMQMKPIEHKTCESCHEDPHKGSLGPPARAATPRPAGRSSRPTRTGHQLPRQDQVPAARRPHRRRLQELPRAVPGPAGAVQGAGLRGVQRLPRGRAPRPAAPQTARQGGGLRGLPHRQRLRRRRATSWSSTRARSSRSRARTPRRPAGAATRSTIGSRRASRRPFTSAARAQPSRALQPAPCCTRRSRRRRAPGATRTCTAGSSPAERRGATTAPAATRRRRSRT